MIPKVVLEIDEAKEILKHLDKETPLYNKILNQVVNAEGKGKL